jgi:hypothetical protein
MMIKPVFSAEFEALLIVSLIVMKIQETRVTRKAEAAGCPMKTKLAAPLYFLTTQTLDEVE